MQSKKNPIKLASNDEKLLKRYGFKIGEPLNSGSFACVCRATFKSEPCAAKVIDLERTSEDYRIKFLPREIYTMKKLKHKYLIEILDIFVVGNRVIVFMELADGGDFLDFLHENQSPLSEDRCRYFYKQFGDALCYMHSKGFAHRDIKCENILLNKERTISKLTDYGFTRTCLERNSGQGLMSNTYCGSTAYVAPEVLKSQPYNPLISDVWSMGVVMYVLLNNRLPFPERDTKKLLRDQLNQSYRFVKTISKQCQDLISLHLNPNPSTRITMNEIFQHEWFGEQKNSFDCYDRIERNDIESQSKISDI
ncbi:protein kinase-like protein 5 [Sarcoptes scabiei]|uniref:Protein kinase-like protein 5 n=1 Tax=Sarcoptes scabiei TaxID=52283 RepID=A0A131ZXH7_SARSC|nr:protein kinase-like protein 5 [Sarcoptes scabiei]